jgi:hypothetical protein
MTRVQHSTIALLVVLAGAGGAACQLKRPDVIGARMIEPRLIDPAGQSSSTPVTSEGKGTGDAVPVRFPSPRSHRPAAAPPGAGRRARGGRGLAMVVGAGPVPRLGAAARVCLEPQRSADRFRHRHGDVGHADHLASRDRRQRPAGRSGRTRHHRYRPRRSDPCDSWSRSRPSCRATWRSRLGGCFRRWRRQASRERASEWRVIVTFKI